jgi:hypothetical protein
MTLFDSRPFIQPEASTSTRKRNLLLRIALEASAVVVFLAALGFAVEIMVATSLEARREGVDGSVPSNHVSKELAEKIRNKYFPKKETTVKRAVKVVQRATRLSLEAPVAETPELPVEVPDMPVADALTAPVVEASEAPLTQSPAVETKPEVSLTREVADESNGDQYEDHLLPLSLDAADDIVLTVRQLVPDYAGLILTGPPGTSKTWYARQVATALTDRDRNRVRFVQFHQSYQYEDFVEGFVPDIVFKRTTPRTDGSDRTHLVAEVKYINSVKPKWEDDEQAITYAASYRAPVVIIHPRVKEKTHGMSLPKHVHAHPIYHYALDRRLRIRMRKSNTLPKVSALCWACRCSPETSSTTTWRAVFIRNQIITS